MTTEPTKTTAILTPEQATELRACLPAITFTAIATREDLQLTSDWRAKAKQGIKKVHDFFDPSVESAHEAHKQAVALRTRCLAPFEEVETKCKTMMNDFDRRERERVAAEQKRLDDEARLRAEQAAQAEREAARKAAAEAKKAGDAAALAAAKQAQEEAAQKAKDIRSGAIPITSTVTVQAEKIAGVSSAVKWSADPNVNKAMLVKAAAKDEGLLCYLLPDLVALNKVMSATRGQVVIPGVKALAQNVTAQRA